jgi:CHAT domain-containing protein/uncharacterized protein HemY
MKDRAFLFAPLRRGGKIFLLLFVLATISLELRAQQTVQTTSGEAAAAEADRLRSQQLEAANTAAIEKYREAATLFQRSGNFHDAAIALKNAGEILQLLGNSAGALIVYQQALSFTRRSKDLVERGKIFNNLSALHFIDGNSKQAEQNALAALRIARQLGHRELEAAALNNLGEAFSNLGDRTKAQEHAQQSLAIWRALNNARGQASASISLGYTYKNVGQPEQAQRSFAEALSLARQANDLALESQALMAIGNINRKTGNNQASLESYTDAKLIAERIGDQTAQAIVQGGIGSIYFEMGDERQALQYLEEATKLMERNGKLWGTAEGKLQLGRLRRSLSEYDHAREYLTESLELFKKLRIPQLQSTALRELGLVYDLIGDTNKAIESYQGALKLTHANEDQREAAYLLNYLGQSCEKLKETDRALQYYREALSLSQRSSDPVGEALIYNNLAHLERDRGNLREARQAVESALAIVESQRTKVASQDLRASYFATVRNTYELYINILMQLHKQNPAAGFNKEAFGISEKARARSFLESLSEARANVRDGVDPVLLAKERELSEAINTKAQLQVQMFMARRNEEADGICKELDTLVAQLAQLRDQIRQASPKVATLSLPQLLSLEEVQQQLLDDDTVLLEYVLGDDRSYVWIVTRTSFSSYELAPRAEIEASAKKLHNLIASRQMVYGESVAARTERQAKVDTEVPIETAKLSRLILGPLAGKFEKKRLLVVPDGALQYISFAALTDPDTGNLLLASHEILNEPSASTLALLQAKAAGRKPALNSVAVLADPVFEIDDPRVKRNAPRNGRRPAIHDAYQALRDFRLSADGQIPRLIASGAEAERIIAAAPWRTGLKAVGFAASRERVFSPELANYRIVHFATHGVVNSERPELSGIVLSLFDNNGNSQNGFLRLHDIYSLNLPADLIVLSACSTGLGKEVRGEGLIGLTRGFMYAGASGVIASLWKVDDDATAELMKHFYDALFQKGMTPAAALRDAQLTLSQNKRWQSPYYWAGFVIQGQYTEMERFKEPFPSRTQLVMFAGVGGILLLGLIFWLRRRRQHS